MEKIIINNIICRYFRRFIRDIASLSDNFSDILYKLFTITV